MIPQNDPISQLARKLYGRATDHVTNAMLAACMGMIRPLATVTEVLFRKQMGERYFADRNTSLGVILIALSGVRFWEGNFSPSSIARRGVHGLPECHWADLAVLLWLGAFLLCCVLHKRAVKQRYRDGVRWHSRSYGIPRFAFITPFVERLLPLLAGAALIWQGGYGTGTLLVLSTLVSHQLRCREATLFHERVLDTIDQQIEAENLSAAVLERLQPEQAEGLVAPLPAYVSDKFRERFVGPRVPPPTAAPSMSAPTESADWAVAAP